MDSEQQQLFLLRRKVTRAARDRDGAAAEQQQPPGIVQLTAVREAVLATQEEVMAECDGREGRVLTSKTSSKTWRTCRMLKTLRTGT